MASIIRNPDGSPRYTNKLNQSASPYLLQHAHNPVDWHPWGPEALALAKRENKPIFLSIGYSTCYWCHVMEREIFANPTMAALMNQHFINIKVDREERPDLDEIYMAARQLLTGEGGWPNNVFLTPNLEPFFAGGTFSADARYGRMSFPELVQSITQGWMHKREDVFTMSATVMERLNEVLTPNEKGRPPAIGYDRVSYLIQHWIRMHDKRNGGFYSAPKFPNETNLLFLMDVYRLRKDVEVLGVISRTLDTMAAGGIFDHVGGGFHRYAVDAEWKVPHFEKMLYNQALLSLVYAEAAELTGKSYYEYIARSTLDFVLNEMTSAEGAFYSAFDAENDAVEGAYYVWDELTIRKLLSEGAARIFFETFDLAELPHFPGHKHPEGKVLYAKKPIDIAARERDLAFDEFQTQLDKIMGKLLLVREGREVPMLDTKIIAAWNGMMIHSFAQVGMLLEEPRYITAAQKAAEFILNKMTTRNFTIGRIYNTAVQIGGFLEDYAWVVAGLLSVYQATDKKIWLTRAIDIINRADDLFFDTASLKAGRGGFFYTSGGKDLIVKIKTADDSAIPSANSVMVHNLITLEQITRGTEYEGAIWRERAVQTLNAFAEAMERSAESHTHLLHGWMLLNTNPEALRAIQPASGSANTGMAMVSKTPSSSHYVKVTARLADDKIIAGENFTVNVRLRIAKGWHVNAYPIVKRDLFPTRITLEGQHLMMKKVQYPDATTIVIGDQEVNVYQDEILIPVLCSLNRLASAGDIEAIQVKVDFQACSDTACLAPAHEMIELPLVISSQ